MPIILFFLFSIFASEPSLVVSPCGDIDCLLEEFERGDLSESPSATDISEYFSGAYKHPISDQCHFKNIKPFIANDKSNLIKGQNLSNYLKRCEKELSNFNKMSIPSMINFDSINYPFSKNPKLLKVEFTYDQEENSKGTKVKGILALKDFKKRPLVIVKNGVFGNADDTAVIREMIMHLTEEAPFHVLVLGNLTGDDFIKDNGFVAMGGFEEGRQIHEIAKIIRSNESNIKDWVYDIHILGVSLGGNASLFSALYNEYLPQEEQVQSHIAFCPVVNLKPAIDNVYGASLTGLIFKFFTKSFLSKILQYVPVLGDIFNPDEDNSREVLKNILIQSTFESIKKRTAEKPWDYEPFKGDSIETLEEMWDYNNFLNFYDEVKSPLLVISAKNDFVVESKTNSLALMQQSMNKENFSFVNLEYGGHCAFAISYGWPTISKILKHYILESSTYRVETKKQMAKIYYLEDLKANPRYKFSKYEWAYNHKTKNLELKLSFRDDSMPTARGNGRCREQDYRFSDLACYKEISYPLDIKTLKQFTIDFPEEPFKQSYFIRWLNTHFIPSDASGTIPYGKAEIPSHIEFQAELPVYLEEL